MRSFDRFACVDWSGRAVAYPPGLALAECDAGDAAPTLVEPASSWSRGGVLDWLLAQARTRANVIVGLDLSPALPFPYFPGLSDSPVDARALWALVDRVAANEPFLAATSFAEHPRYAPYFRLHGGREGSAFGGGAGRYRRVEARQRAAGVSPVSCFNLVGPAQVGKSSLSGMRVLHRLAGRVPVWPFDPLPPTGPVVVEIYTSIAARAAGVPKGRSKVRDAASLDAALANLSSRPHAPLARYDDHATDAILTAAWLRHVAHDAALWHPEGLEAVRQTEGWTFGVP